MEIKFFVPAIPVPQPRQRHRIVGKGAGSYVCNYTPSKSPVNAFKATARLAAKESLRGVPPTIGEVSVRFIFLLPRPKSQIWKTRPMPRLPHVKKPDIDNLTKSLLDAMTGLLWVDDSQVSKIVAEKWIASGDEHPGVEVEISTDNMWERK